MDAAASFPPPAWLLVCPFPHAPVSSTMLQKEAVRVDARACVVVYIFRSVYTVLSCVCASASSTYICAARWIAYLLGRGRFIECGRRRSDSHVFTSRQFFHFAPLPSRTRTFDVPGRLAVWLFLPLFPFESLISSVFSFGSVGLISRYPFVLYATRNSKGRLKPTSTFKLPSRVCEWQNGHD